MLVPLLLDLASAPAVPVSVTAYATLPTINFYVMRPLWVSETPTDTIVVTPIAAPSGSFQ